jgi:hypothetical protein
LWKAAQLREVGRVHLAGRRRQKDELLLEIRLMSLSTSKFLAAPLSKAEKSPATLDHPFVF